MAQEIKPCKQVQATLTLPGSKSYTHRALMAAALAGGESVLTNACLLYTSDAADE